MTTITPARRLDFARSPGDRLTTSVRLDNDAPPFFVALWWRPQMRSWLIDLATATGAPIVTSAWLRDRTDCLLGIATPGRPRGAIISYDPNGGGIEPTLESYTTGGASVYYLPGGFDPTTFSLYAVSVT